MVRVLVHAWHNIHMEMAGSFVAVYAVYIVSDKIGVSHSSRGTGGDDRDE